jgi:hypothetical protein
MRLRPESKGLNIVVRGSFNPAIFHPSWFAKCDLIRSQEADAAKIVIVNPDVADFSLGWGQFRAFQDTFQISTTEEPYYEPVKDLIIGTFTYLHHTPIYQLGINFDFEYQMASEKSWHNVGNTLVPKPFWEEVLDNPGMRSLIVQGERSDGEKGHIWTTVVPSGKFKFGIGISINDHYELNSNNVVGGGVDTLKRILSNNWKISLQKAEEIAHHIAQVGAGQ